MLQWRRTASFERFAVAANALILAAGVNSTDPLDLTPGVLEVLPYFDGRPTTEGLAAIRRELGIRVEKDLVRKLTDFQILVPTSQ